MSKFDLRRLRADRRQVHDSARPRGIDRRSQYGRDGTGLAKVRRRIEVRWNEDEDTRGSLKRRSERGRVVDVRLGKVTAPARPGLAFTGLANHASDGLARGQKVARYLSADIASNSSNCKHSSPIVESHSGMRNGKDYRPWQHPGSRAMKCLAS